MELMTALPWNVCINIFGDPSGTSLRISSNWRPKSMLVYMLLFCLRLSGGIYFNHFSSFFVYLYSGCVWSTTSSNIFDVSRTYISLCIAREYVCCHRSNDRQTCGQPRLRCMYCVVYLLSIICSNISTENDVFLSSCDHRNMIGMKKQRPWC